MTVSPLINLLTYPLSNNDITASPALTAFGSLLIAPASFEVHVAEYKKVAKIVQATETSVAVRTVSHTLPHSRDSIWSRRMKRAEAFIPRGTKGWKFHRSGRTAAVVATTGHKSYGAISIRERLSSPCLSKHKTCFLHLNDSISTRSHC